MSKIKLYAAATLTGILAQVSLSYLGTALEMVFEGGSALTKVVAFPWWIHIIIISLILSWSVAEELFFRKFLWWLSEKYVGKTFAFFSTSILFAAAHIALGPLDALMLLLFSFLLGYWRLKHSLRYSVICHLTFNIFGIGISIL